MLGEEQLAWLIDELTTSSKSHALVVWGNSFPWIGPPNDSGEGWAGHPDERRIIADAIAAAGIDNLVMVSGDAHMVALDDGTNSDYSTDGKCRIPGLAGRRTRQARKLKGGPYSDGTFPGGGQFGLIDIDDAGSQITVVLSGHTWDGKTLVEKQFTMAVDLP